MRRVVSNLALAALSVLVTLGILELALRVAPERLLPLGSYGASRFEPSLGLAVHRVPAIYNKVRFVRRVPNSRGWLDVEHAESKPPGRVRIGFFGDSYVESAQVPIEAAFFRRLPERLAGVPVESLAFGVSGWGTLHAFRAARLEGERFDVDLQVYVFVENDPGDNAWSISAARQPMPMPFAVPSDAPPGYVERWSRSPDSLPFWYGPAKTGQARLRVAQVLWSRLSLLRAARKPSPGAATAFVDGGMWGRTPAGATPRPTELPSSWPGVYRREAEALGRSLLAEWQRNAGENRRELVVLYVPRGERQLRGEVVGEDTWRGWLRATCRELGIPVIDPTEELAAESRRQGPMFDDHFSPAGHEVIARILARALEAPVARLAAASR